jgi:hypothetical protein
MEPELGLGLHQGPCLIAASLKTGDITPPPPFLLFFWYV